MIELFILWKLTRIRDDLSDGESMDWFWFLVFSLFVTWPILLYNIMRRRGDSRYMSASVAVGVAAISLAFGLGYYILLGVFALGYVAYLLSTVDEDEYI